jgi:glycosyltransferase involved in cell wall biosynthesis
MNRPRVSVIIPVFNRGGFLAEAVASVMEGSYRDFEVIVVDDGSTDDTASSLGSYGAGVRYHYQENRGPASARNAGVALAMGEYIAFLDSDDLWAKEKLETQVDYLDSHPDIRTCHTGEVWIKNGKRLNQSKRHVKCGGDIFERCLPLCIISPSSILMERSLFDELGGFDEDLPVCEDYDLWLRMTLSCPVGFIDEPLVVKRGGHPDQLSRAFWGMDRFRIKSLSGLILRGEVEGERRGAVLAEIARKCRIVAGGARKRGREEEARGYELLPGMLSKVPVGVDGIVRFLRRVTVTVGGTRGDVLPAAPVLAAGRKGG